MSEFESRKLGDLRVVDLRAELEKRGLDKTGVKQILVERLQKALVDEGLDPEVYQFDMPDKKQRTSITPASAVDNEDDQTEEANEKDTEQGENKNDDTSSSTKEVTKEGSLAKKESDSKDLKNLKLNEEKQEKDDRKDKNEDKEESPIQLTLEEEEVLHDNDVDNGENDTDTASKENLSGSDEKKATKDAPETAKETTEINPAQQDVKKDEKSTTAENSDAGTNTKIKGISDSQNRNLWITNISQTTRATELKQALSAYGKVIGAKVVINARYPGACCYGYVKMETVEDANNCIIKLNNTELNGQIIRIEKVRPEHLNPNLNINKRLDREKSRPKSSSMMKGDREDKGKFHDDKQDKKTDKLLEKKDKLDDPKGEGIMDQRQQLKRSRSSERRSRDRHRRRTRSRERTERSLSSKSRRREREIALTFDKIKNECDRERKRERERMLREEKRRREEALRQREIERRQRNEAQRLEREREKLRLERERLERERADLMLLERERQKLEREKLELEKLELERVKMRIQEEERRKRPAPYGRDRSYEDRKRVASDRHFDEPPPPPRFDPPPRERDMRDPSRGREAPGPSVSKYNSQVPKETRYGEHERDRSPHFRGGVRDDRDRRPMGEHKADMRSSRDHRYDAPKETGRFERGGAGSGGVWGHSSQGKVFNANNANPPQKSWGKESWRQGDSSGNSERWNSGGSRNGAPLSGGSFSNNSNMMNLGPSCPPPPEYTPNKYASAITYRKMKMF